MNGAAAAIQLLTELLRQAASVSALMKTAQDQGRELTLEEVSAVAAKDDLARQDLVAAIAAAKGS